MRKTFTLIFCMLIVAASFAQRPEGVVKRANVAPIIDGEIDTVWNGANVYNIDQPYGTENPTIGASGESTWKALWDDTGIYVLLEVNDDDFYPHYQAGVNSWEADKPEIYFDVNYVLEDGAGASGGNGHYQVAPEFAADLLDGTPTTEASGVVYAFKVEDPSYVAEYFMPFTYLLTKEGAPMDQAEVFGFDVTIIDRDEATNSRDRAVWANTGAQNESWSNLDDAGHLTLEGGEPPVYIDEINISGPTEITEDNQTIQIQVEVLPEDATSKAVVWTIEGKDGAIPRATISPTGLITPVIDEVIIIQAWSPDYFAFSDPMTITITGQIATVFELSYIKDGDFNMADSVGTPSSYWNGGAVIVDGVAECDPPPGGANPWDWVFSQVINVPIELKDENFIFSFKAWADEQRTFNVDFEDSANDYNRYGISSDSVSNGKSDWTFDVTTEPTWYIFHTNFEEMQENTNQSLQFMLGLADAKVYLDSVSLVMDETEKVAVDDIVLTGGTISEDNGTLQIGVEVLPANATNKSVKWSVAAAEGSTGRATISSSGLLTAIIDGTVTVTAKSHDGLIVKTIDVEISGQEVTIDDVNVIKNGDMSMVEGTAATYWGGWTDASPGHTVVDGVSVHTPVGSADVWRYQFIQENLSALPNIPYVFKFKAWADADRSFNVDFEDTEANGYRRYGASSDPRANVTDQEGRSEWLVDVTTTPTEYTFDVIFDEILETTVQKVAFMLGLSDIATYIDDVALISEADMELFTGIKDNNIESFKVYPNPAQSVLHVDLPKANINVAIYNSIGVKMEETLVNGTHHVFDVSGYSKGLYFIKAEDAVMKFIR